MIIPDSTLNSVVCIRAHGEDKKKYILGSGFVYSILDRMLDDKTSICTHYLITSKHVIEGYSNIFISFGNSDEEIELKLEKYHPLAFSKNKSIWFEHEVLDIALILINPDIIKEKCSNYEYFENSLTLDSMKDKGVSEGDSICILGFPQIFKNHREEEIKTLITRHGSIANIKKLFSLETPEFVVDSLIYPGNSGGPIILIPRFNNDLGKGNIENPILIGMVTSYYSHREKALSERYPFEQKVLFEDNSGLVSAYPLDFIHEMAEYSKEKLKQYVHISAKNIEIINSEDDLKQFFINSIKDSVKSEIKSNLSNLTSSEVIKLINNDIDRNKELDEAVLDYFIKNNFEFGIKNLRSLFEYEFIGEFISPVESEKILKLLDKWEQKIKN